LWFQSQEIFNYEAITNTTENNKNRREKFKGPKLIKRMLIVTPIFTFISLGNMIRLKGIEDIMAIQIVSILTSGIGIGASFFSIIMPVNK
jgi:hypothetical protein